MSILGGDLIKQTDDVVRSEFKWPTQPTTIVKPAMAWDAIYMIGKPENNRCPVLVSRLADIVGPFKILHSGYSDIRMVRPFEKMVEELNAPDILSELGVVEFTKVETKLIGPILKATLHYRMQSGATTTLLCALDYQ